LLLEEAAPRSRRRQLVRFAAGPGVDWPFVQTVWFWAMAAFKFCVWLVVFAVLRLTLWARQVRKADRQ
jgi:hypothetical protein